MDGWIAKEAMSDINEANCTTRARPTVCEACVPLLTCSAGNGVHLSAIVTPSRTHCHLKERRRRRATEEKEMTIG